MKKYFYRATARLQAVVATVVVALSSIFVNKAFAGPTAPSSLPSAGVTSVGDVFNLFCNAFGWMFVALVVFSSVMALWAAFNYMTAGDNPEKVSKATKTLIYTAVAVAVALLARALPLVVGDILQVSGVGSC